MGQPASGAVWVALAGREQRAWPNATAKPRATGTRLSLFVLLVAFAAVRTQTRGPKDAKA